jgi:hypothetical protein
MAVCFRILDLGTQQTTYQGQQKSAHKILISWELPDEKMADGKPFTISSRYTWSMHEKATLRKHLESWRGLPFQDRDFGPEGFNIKNILGKACLLTVTHSENGEKQYANIAAVGKLMKGMTAPSPVNELTYLWLHPTHWSDEIFSKLSQGLQGVIMRSPEYKSIVMGHEPQPTGTEDFARDFGLADGEQIPF